MSAAARGQPELEVVLSQERPKRVHKPPSRFDDSTTDQSSQPQIPAPSVAANVKGTTKEMERAEDHTDSSKSLLPGARLTRDQCTSKLRGQQILVYWPDDRNWYLAQVQDVTATKISLWYPPDADDSDAEDDEGWEEVMDIADGVRQQLLALRSTSGAIVSKKAQPAVRVEKKKSAKVAPQAQPGKPTELGPPRVADSGKTGAGSSKAASDIGHILGVASTESKKTGTKEVLDPKELKQFENWKGCTEEGRNIRRKVHKSFLEALRLVPRQEATDEEVSDAATCVENALYKEHKLGKGYKIQARALLFNFRDTKNPLLRTRTVKGEVNPQLLSRATAQELASPELAMWRKSKEEELGKNKFLPQVPDNEPLQRFTHKGVEIINRVSSDLDLAGASSSSDYKQRKPAATDRNEQPSVQWPSTETTREACPEQGELSTRLASPKETVPSAPEKGALSSSVADVTSKPDSVPLAATDLPMTETKEGKANATTGLDSSKSGGSPRAEGSARGPAVRSSVVRGLGRITAASTSSDPQLHSNDSASKTWRGEFWKGEVEDPEGPPMCTMRAVYRSGDSGAFSLSLPDRLVIKGRVRLDKLDDFLRQLKHSKSRVVTVAVLSPAEDSSPEDTKAVESFYRKHKRCGVATPEENQELYFVPQCWVADAVLEGSTPLKEEELLLVLVYRPPKPTTSPMVGVEVDAGDQLLSESPRAASEVPPKEPKPEKKVSRRVRWSDHADIAPLATHASPPREHHLHVKSPRMLGQYHMHSEEEFVPLSPNRTEALNQLQPRDELALKDGTQEEPDIPKDDSEEPDSGDQQRKRMKVEQGLPIPEHSVSAQAQAIKSEPPVPAAGMTNATPPLDQAGALMLEKLAEQLNANAGLLGPTLPSSRPDQVPPTTSSEGAGNPKAATDSVALPQDASNILSQLLASGGLAGLVDKGQQPPLPDAKSPAVAMYNSVPSVSSGIVAPPLPRTAHVVPPGPPQQMQQQQPPLPMDTSQTLPYVGTSRGPSALQVSQGMRSSGYVYQQTLPSNLPPLGTGVGQATGIGLAPLPNSYPSQVHANHWNSRTTESQGGIPNPLQMRTGLADGHHSVMGMASVNNFSNSQMLPQQQHKPLPYVQGNRSIAANSNMAYMGYAKRDHGRSASAHQGVHGQAVLPHMQPQSFQQHYPQQPSTQLGGQAFGYGAPSHNNTLGNVRQIGNPVGFQTNNDFKSARWDQLPQAPGMGVGNRQPNVGAYQYETPKNRGGMSGRGRGGPRGRGPHRGRGNNRGKKKGWQGH